MKKRVKKGEEYYTINICGVIESHVELYTNFDNSCYESGNYFITSKQALAMIKKLQKVLKGADVIEWPSEEEILNKEISCNPFCSNNKEGTLPGYENGLYNGFNKGFGYCKNWLNSKIIK